MKLNTLQMQLIALMLVCFSPIASSSPNEDTPPVANADQKVSDLRAGSLSVNNEGTANYRVPIELPKGRRGVSPILALAYSSGGGNGLMGIGWRLEGLPAIGRMNFGNGVNFDGKDNYGYLPSFGSSGVSPDNRLVEIGSGYFHTARDSYHRYEQYGTCGDGPCYWLVRAKDGTVSYFGGDTSTTVTHSYTCNNGSCMSALQGLGGIRKWPLYKVVDPDGNYYQVDWRVIDSAIVPVKITYTKSIPSPLAWHYTVVFDYGSRPDSTPAPEHSSVRLENVTIRAYGSELYHYHLAYDLSPTTGRSRLTAIQQIGPNGETLPAKRFSWQDGTNGFDDNYVIHTTYTPTGGALQPGWESVTGDFNGDGFIDLALINFANGYLKVSCAQGGVTGLGPLVPHPENGSSTHIIPVTNSWQTKVGDFDGDGRDDLVFAAQDKTGKFLFQMPGTNTASCFGSLDKGHTHLPGVVNLPARIIDADVNGDGYKDILIVSLGWQDPANPTVTSLDPNLDFNNPAVANQWIKYLWVQGFLGGPAGLSKTGFFKSKALPTSPLFHRHEYSEFTARGSGWDVFVSDFNGDGRSDLAAVYQGRGGRLVFEMTGKEDTPSMVIGGPGQLLNEGYQLPQGDDWHSLHHGGAYPEKEWTAFAADVNGDGKSDLVMAYNGPANAVAPYSGDPTRPYGRQVHYMLGGPSGLSQGFGEYVGLRINRSLVFSGGTPYAGWVSFPCDVTGDHMPDLCMVYQGIQGRSIDWAIGSPAGPSAWERTQPVSANLPDEKNNSIFPFAWNRWTTIPGDFNGDESTDLVFSYLGKYGCYIDYAMGQPNRLGTIVGHPKNTNSSTSYCQRFDGGGAARFTDLNGDDRPDGTRTASSSDGRWTAFRADINGDGKDDLIFVYHGASGRHIKYLLARPGNPDLLTTIDNGFGGKREISYKPAAHVVGAIQPGISGPGKPNRTFRMLVVNVRNSNGRDRTETTNYDYEDGRLQEGFVRDRRDLGFKKIVRQDITRNVREVTAFNQAPPLHGTVASNSISRLIEQTGISLSWNVYDVATPFPGTQDIRIVDKVSNYSESGVVTHHKNEHFEYDNWGAHTSERICENSFCTLKTYLYNNVDNASQYIVSQPRESMTSSNGRILSWERYHYWPGAALNHRLESMGRYLCADAEQCTSTTQSARWVRTLRYSAYDPYGQPLTTFNALGSETNFVFDPYSHIHITRKAQWVTTNNTRVALVNEYRYDAAGNQTLERDAANKIDTKVTSYDAFGRKTEERYPDGGWRRWRYDSWGDINNQSVRSEIAEDPSRTSWSRSYFDGVGFVWRESRKGDNSAIISQDNKDVYVRKNNLGTLRQLDSSEPYFASSSAKTWRRLEREAETERLRRISWVVNDAISVQESLNYGPATPPAASEVRVVTRRDARDYLTTEYFDARDLLTRKVDANSGNMWNSYDEAKRHTVAKISVSAGSNITFSTKYDSWGRVRETNDPSLGIVSNEYDDIGNLTKRTDGAGHVTTFAYDELSRIQKRETHDGVITYEYDSPLTNGWWRLGRVNDLSGSTVFSYDDLGRVVTKSTKITGLANDFVEKYSYDSRGRLIRKELPDNTRLEYAYTDAGSLGTLKMAGTILAKFSRHDASGRVQRRENRNGTITNLTYKPQGYLATLSTSGPGNVKLQQLSYTYDEVWNVKAISDSRPLKQLGGINTDETVSYTYDPLNRLAQSTSPITGNGLFEFDQATNLVRKENMRFVIDGQKAISGSDIPSGTQTFAATYDGAGNLVQKQQGTTSWSYVHNQDGKLKAVLLGGQTTILEFSYDYTGKRTKKIHHRSNGTAVTTYYVGGDYEIQIDSSAPSQWQKTRHVGGPAGGKLTSWTSTQDIGLATLGGPGPHSYVTPAANMGALQPLSHLTASTSVTKEAWYYVNHLGTTSAVADGNGNVIARIAYRPYGEIVSTNSVGSNIVTHKFTGKEFDQESGLYDFGPRIYDPSVGRFIEADTIIPNPMDSRSYNRYAYALGNPVRYTDPSGHEPEEKKDYKEYTVRQGDTMGSIAKDQLGSAQRYKEIAKHNPQISDPNYVYPGNVLRIPTTCPTDCVKKEEPPARAGTSGDQRTLFWRTPPASSGVDKEKLLHNSERYSAVRTLDRGHAGSLVIVASGPGPISHFFGRQITEWDDWVGTRNNSTPMTLLKLFTTFWYPTLMAGGMGFGMEYDHIFEMPGNIMYLGGVRPPGSDQTPEEIEHSAGDK